MIYDPLSAVKILNLVEAGVLLNESKETVRKNAEKHPIWKKYFYMTGNEYRTSPHLLMLAQEELVGLRGDA